MAAVIYMFHAIGELESDDWADPHYSFSREKYIEFLNKAKSVKSIKQAQSKNSKHGCIMTFDDGHISNYWAGKYIAENGYGSADFFINPAKVGLPYYMSWQQIKALADLGMSIQSHGLDHSFLSDLDDDELCYQLSESKKIIEAHVDQRVTILAPPGGRYDKRTVSKARELGYQIMSISRPGRVKDINDFIQPRIAVMKKSSVDQLLANRNRLNHKIIIQKVKYSSLKLGKRVIGNERYEKLRWFILGGGK